MHDAARMQPALSQLPGSPAAVLSHSSPSVPMCTGNVAAFDMDGEGIVSPGGVGFDINCGEHSAVGLPSMAGLGLRADYLPC